MVPLRALWLLRAGQSLRWPWLRDRWATYISRPRAGEIGLDVTHLRYPLGDFVWARFDVVDRLLSFPEEHHFVTVHRASRHITGNVRTGRPVRQPENPEFVVLDITGLGLGNAEGWAHGYLEMREGRLQVRGYDAAALPEAPAGARVVSAPAVGVAV